MLALVDKSKKIGTKADEGESKVAKIFNLHA
jgi:hypothetical protein